MKICIIGPSGTGKTTLAEYIAARYRIPFITGSSRLLSIGYGVESHADLIKLCADKPQEVLELYKKIKDLRIEILQKDNVVSDRSLIDLLVYYTIQLSPFMSMLDDDQFMYDLQSDIKKYEVTYIFLPYNFKAKIEDNNRRVTNAMYQKYISLLFDITIKTSECSICKFITIEEWDWETRVLIVDKLFEKTLWQKIKKLWQKLIKKNQ